MSTYRLDRLFAPRSVALVGASPRETSLGRAILNNLRAGGWRGPLWLVNPKHREIEGLQAIQKPSDLPEAPDLVVITAPPPAVPDVVAQSAAIGAATAMGSHISGHMKIALISVRDYHPEHIFVCVVSKYGNIIGGIRIRGGYCWTYLKSLI